MAHSDIGAILTVAPAGGDLGDRAAWARLADALASVAPDAKLEVTDASTEFEAARALQRYCAELEYDDFALVILHGDVSKGADGDLVVSIASEQHLTGATLRAALKTTGASRQLVILTGSFPHGSLSVDDLRAHWEAGDRSIAVLAAPVHDLSPEAFSLRLALALERGFDGTLEAWARATQRAGSDVAVLSASQGARSWRIAPAVLAKIDAGDLEDDDIAIADFEAITPEPATAPPPLSLPEMLELRRRKLLDHDGPNATWGRPGLAPKRGSAPRSAGGFARYKRSTESPDQQAVRRSAAEVSPGKLHTDAPTRMRVADPRIVSVALTRDAARSAAEVLAGGSLNDLSTHDLMMTGLMSVSLRDPDDAFDIRPLSPEMQTIDHERLAAFLDQNPLRDHTAREGAGLWRWRVTPKKSGNYTLNIAATAYVSSDMIAGREGALVPAPIQSEDVPISVRVNSGLALRAAMRWVVVGAASVALFDLGLKPALENPEAITAAVGSAIEWFNGLGRAD